MGDASIVWIASAGRPLCPRTRSPHGALADNGYGDEGASGTAKCWRPLRSREPILAGRSRVDAPLRTAIASPVERRTQSRLPKRVNRRFRPSPFAPRAERAKLTQNRVHPICTLKPSLEDLGLAEEAGQTRRPCRVARGNRTRAPSDPGVTVSCHRALLTCRQYARTHCQWRTGGAVFRVARSTTV